MAECKLTNLSKDFGKIPDKQNDLLQSLGKPHIDSFNYMLDEGLSQSIKDTPVQLTLPNGDKIVLRLDDVHIEQPIVPPNIIGVKNYKMYPTECRQKGETYKGNIRVKFGWSINGIEQESFENDLGEIPIMIKSNRCHLNKMSPKELVAHSEHEQEWGGYFIIKGLERLIRMLIMTRRNYPVAIKRPSWKSRGEQFSDLGIFLRSVRDDNTTSINTLHYVTDGTLKLAFTIDRTVYYVPVMMMLKCFIDTVETYIFRNLIAGCEQVIQENNVMNMFHQLHLDGLYSHEQCKARLGKMFRIKFPELSSDVSNIDVCDHIIKHYIFVHLDKPIDKFNLLIFMSKKLFFLVNDTCIVENVDSLMMQECLLGGYLYLQILKRKLYVWLTNLKTLILKRAISAGTRYTLTMQEMLSVIKQKNNISAQMENFLSTGNIKPFDGLGSVQSNGLTVVLENINRLRYMSHFRMLHRGSFFQELRSSEIRRLQPDTWGFICPIHTPDGTLCGLLNHLTVDCIVTKSPPANLKNEIPAILVEMGMVLLDSLTVNWKCSYTVMLDGRIIGLIENNIISKVVHNLRLLKVEGQKVPSTLEIVLVSKNGTVPTQYPGLFLFTNANRFMRPVINLAAQKIEYIGTFEQIFMDICVSSKNFIAKVTTHQEISNLTIFSHVANLIPLLDNNQSPRNIYQCQMAKQTMGTPCHNWKQQSETKMYRLTTPTTSLFRPAHHDALNMDDFSMGTNAVIVVLSHTGFDMEDAIIINKASFERGFGHGMIYKSEFINLNDKKSYFVRDPNKKSDLAKTLDRDGLPMPGTIIKNGDAYYCYYDADKLDYVIGYYKNSEIAYVDNIKLCGSLNPQDPGKACITFRIPRNPCIGDKFASRMGQKGILSCLCNAEDMPFSETGMIPDIIFNPHGLPTRMSVAKMYEMMAGKSAAMHGLVHDATSFKFNEEYTAADYFGELLKHGGYSYRGYERICSGTHGIEVKANIFFGIVHYQRLRHMVSDKWQVRSTGPIDALTRQPLKGRQRGGGIRFGEMERDTMITHGSTYLLHDRLLHCSDKTTVLTCTNCGSLLALEIINKGFYESQKCSLCNDYLNAIEIPHIYKYLLMQLATCSINFKYIFKHV